MQPGLKGPDISSKLKWKESWLYIRMLLPSVCRNSTTGNRTSFPLRWKRFITQPWLQAFNNVICAENKMLFEKEVWRKKNKPTPPSSVKAHWFNHFISRRLRFCFSAVPCNWMESVLHLPTNHSLSIRWLDAEVHQLAAQIARFSDELCWKYFTTYTVLSQKERPHVHSLANVRFRSC